MNGRGFSVASQLSFSFADLISRELRISHLSLGISLPKKLLKLGKPMTNLLRFADDILADYIVS